MLMLCDPFHLFVQVTATAISLFPHFCEYVNEEWSFLLIIGNGCKRISLATCTQLAFLQTSAINCFPTDLA
ncbi:hypothetical protein CW304_25780 [Bacillus sp. UFRGS-B20]|nr:hypothetical protein CW304_25780 [Bacillus sp. UFRGS-B20]